MSKSHQNNRRKSYGRRQHELHERNQRDHILVDDEAGYADFGPAAIADRFRFLDPRPPRLHYALGD